MSKDYGRPPRADENRALVEERLRDVRESGGIRETLTIEWRGQPQHIEVIDMPVDSLYYNPGTHRIRAQRSHDPERDRTLAADPWSMESQDYLRYLLQALPADPSKRDPDFDVLKESLREFKQNDPGLITWEGVLVNANTRRAALKELGTSHIRVGVLPESCTWSDVSAVELSLQLRKEHKRDYSYINRLLAIDEQVSLGRPLQDIAREFRIQTRTCEQDLWILACLRDLIDRSKDDETQLRLLDFEDAQEKLRELHRRYSRDLAVSKDNADLMKECRLAAIALGYSKTDIRLIEPEFKARYLDQILPDSLKPARSASSAVAIPGLGRSIKATNPKVAEAKALTDSILKLKAVESAAGDVSANRLNMATQTIAQVHEVFETCFDRAGKDARIRKRKQAAPDRIADACQDLEQCITDLVLARASRSLDEEAFDEAVLQLRDVMRKLAMESARSIQAPGDGVIWLLEAGQQGEHI